MARIHPGVGQTSGASERSLQRHKWGNILGPDRFVDLYPIYERMRTAGPVSFIPFLQQWAVVGYDEARGLG